MSRSEDIGGVLQSLMERYRKGERNFITEAVRKHPDLAAEIRDLFPTFTLLEGAGEKGLAVCEAALGTLDASPLAVGTDLRRLGEYRIVREVGRGGMGIVFEAEQESLGRRVALKVLPFHQLLDPKQLERFHREARAAAGLQHPNIVPVHGVGEDRGIHFYVMQFVKGEGLDQVILELRPLRSPGVRTNGNEAGAGSVDPMNSSALLLMKGGAMESSPSDARYFDSVARVGTAVADALAYAHTQGILHRDIKPSNLLLDERGTVWVTDFGLAKADGDANDDVTRSGEVVGTLRYIAPERLQGWSDPRSDIYSLGLTLYELATLTPAFGDTDRGRLLRSVAEEEPLRPSRADRRLPRDLETVILKAIAKEPSQRYATAAELRADLQRFIDRKPVVARPSSLLRKGVKWARRRKAVAALLGVVALAVIVMFVGSLWYSARLSREIAKSEASFQRAREPVEKLLATYANPAPNPQERKAEPIVLLETALRFYEGFLAERAYDVRILEGAASGYEQFGDFQRKQLQHSKADGSYRQAFDLRKEMAAKGIEKDDGACRSRLLNKVSMALRTLDRHGESEQAFAAAMALRKRPVHLSFSIPVVVPAGKGPYSITTADLDGDRDLDLATANMNDDTITVALNGGAKSFTSAQVPVGKAPISITSADLDGDADLDLAVAHRNSNDVGILLNAGAGSVASPVFIPVSNQAWCVKAADFDGDGDADLAVATGKETLTILRNDGTGKFPAPEHVKIGLLPNNLYIADLDGDGDPDIAAACSGSYSSSDLGGIALALNDGKGRFAVGPKVTAGANPMMVTAGDFNGDGVLDLVGVNESYDRISISRGEGKATFGRVPPPGIYAV